MDARARRKVKPTSKRYELKSWQSKTSGQPRSSNRTRPHIAARSHNPENVDSAVQDQIEVRQYGDAAISHGPFKYSRNTRWNAICLPLSLDGRVRATRAPMASNVRSADPSCRHKSETTVSRSCARLS